MLRDRLAHTLAFALSPVTAPSGFGVKISKPAFLLKNGFLAKLRPVAPWLFGKPMVFATAGKVSGWNPRSFAHRKFWKGHGSSRPLVIRLDARQSFDTGNFHQPPRPDTDGFDLTAGYHFAQLGLADSQHFSGFGLGTKDRLHGVTLRRDRREIAWALAE